MKYDNKFSRTMYSKKQMDVDLVRTLLRFNILLPLD